MTNVLRAYKLDQLSMVASYRGDINMNNVEIWHILAVAGGSLTIGGTIAGIMFNLIINHINKRFDETNKKFEGVDKRFDETNKRIDEACLQSRAAK